MSEGKNAWASKSLEMERVNRRALHNRRKRKRDSWEAKDRKNKRLYSHEYREMEDDRDA